MKNSPFRQSFLAVVFCFIALCSNAYCANALTQDQVNGLVTKTLNVLSENYIDTDSIPLIESGILTRQQNGVYSAISSLDEFAEMLGRDIRNISGDLHLSLQIQDPDAELTHILRVDDGRLSYNHAFEEVKYLHGNIGYLKFNKFHPSSDAMETADTAMAFLQRADGLIIDLRDAVGGSPALAQHILSYFFPTGTELWSVEERGKTNSRNIIVDIQPVHSRFHKDFPVWVLTSNATASASELFAGVLQEHGKAKIIGGQTAGAGYYVGVRSITDQLTFRISLAKPVLSVSKKNWEKTGIKPDLQVHYLDALDIAHQSALVVD